MADQIKAALFRKYRLSDYFIVPDSETVIDRAAIKYRVHSPKVGEWYEITLKRAGDRVDIAASVHKNRHAHTRFLATVGLTDLDESVYTCIKHLRRDDAAPSTQPRKRE